MQRAVPYINNPAAVSADCNLRRLELTVFRSIGATRHDVADNAIEAGAGFRQGLWHSYSVTDGLPSSIIFDMHQDRSGRLWCATEQGVCAFDGSTFRTLNLEIPLGGAPVQRIREDGGGWLWLASAAALAGYRNGKSLVFSGLEPAAPDRRQLVADGLGRIWLVDRGGVMRVEDDRLVGLSRPVSGAADIRLFAGAESVWIGGPSWLRRFGESDADDITIPLTGEEAIDLLDLPSGSVWVATRTSVNRLEGETLVPVAHGEGLFGSRVMGLRTDAAGQVWLLTDTGLSRFDGSTFSLESGLPAVDGSAQDFHVDREGNSWIPSSTGGVHHGYGSELVHFTSAEGLAHDAVNAVLEDGDGRIWIGTHGGGVSRYNGGQFRIFTTRDGLPHNGMDPLLEDRAGMLWIGTVAGLSRFDGSSFHNFSTAQGVAGDTIASIVEGASGTVWVGTRERGLYSYSGSEFRVWRCSGGLVNDSVNAVMEDSRGRVWVGTTAGVSCIEGETITNYTAADGMPNHHIRAVCEDREGNLWFGSMGGGAIRFDGSRFTAFTSRDGLPDNRVQALLVDRDGLLWMGTRGGGLCRYDGTSFSVFNRDHGLTDDHVRAITQDANGRLWISTYGGGVDRFDGTVFQALSRQDGLASNTVNQILEDRSGAIWIAIDGGLTRYRPQTTAPQLRLEVIAGRSYGEIDEVRLLETQEFVIFEFAGQSLSTSSERMAYVCRMEGVDTDWQVIYGRRIEYHHVGIGTYRFFAHAVDRDLNYSPVTEVRLEVVPDPREKQIDELETSVRARTRELARLNAELEKRVDERTANLKTANEQLKSFATRLGQSNRELQDFAYVSSHDLQEPLRKIQAFGGRLAERESDRLSEQARDYLARMQDAARRMQILINDLLTFSRVTTRGQPFVQVDLHDTAVTVASDLEVRLEQTGGRIEMGDLPMVEADPTQMHQLLLNLFGNALKFHREGVPPLVNVSARLADDVCRLTVVDNGIGFEEKYLDRIFSPFQRLHGRLEYEGTGMGLAICRKIVERHGGEITATSKPGVGTSFEVALPHTHSSRWDAT